MGITNRDKFTAHSDNEHSVLLAHIYDMAMRSFDKNIPVYGPFLSESRQSDVLSRLQNLPQRPTLFGGYEDADRKMIAFIPEGICPSYPIAVLKVTTPDMPRLSHRDFLGTVIGAGLKRESVGDILIRGNDCYILLVDNIARFAADNIIRVGSCGVSTSLCKLCDVDFPQREFTPVTSTVSQLRLDSVVTVFTKAGRAAAQEYILSGRVFVNGICNQKPDFHLSDGDIISVRGTGKAILESGGQSKKGRVFITLNKYA